MVITKRKKKTLGSFGHFLNKFMGSEAAVDSAEISTIFFCLSYQMSFCLQMWLLDWKWKNLKSRF